MIYVCVTLIILTIIIVAEIVRRSCKKYDVISFKESIDLVGIPVMTLYQNKKKFNFLLDTGCENSVIDQKYVNKLQHTADHNKKTIIYGVGGEMESYNITTILHNSIEYDVEFQVADMSIPFKTVKEECGVTLHGILGNDFFCKYQYVLDYKTMKAYSKK